jgi:prepilin-type N-terminal cleavage/methylation domain-containing protein
MENKLPDETRRTEAGFTLVEALCAIVILAFGLMAVTNLLLVAASSNTVANQSSAATAVASQGMDILTATPWNNLVPGGDINNDVGGPVACSAVIPAGTYNCDSDISGVGLVHTRWAITATADVRMLFIQVRSEGTGALAGARSRAEFTSFRSCTGPAPCPQLP